MLLGKQGQQDIFLVDVGQGHKGLGGGQALGEQELAVGAVLTQDLCLGQGLGQHIAAGRVPLHDPHPDMVFQQLLAQVEGNGTAAHDEGIAHRTHGQMDALEELVGLFLRCKKGDLIAGLEHKITVGDDDPAVALHGTDQDIALEPGGDLPDSHAVQCLCLGQGELDQPHPAFRKGIDLAGTGEAQQVGDLPRRRHLRVDDGRNADLLFDEVQLMAVGGVAHTGNGVAVARLFGKHAAEQVQLVRAGNCNEHVRLLDSRLGQRCDGGAVAGNAHHVIGFADMLHTGLVGIDDRDIVAFLAELTCQRCADFAAAHQNDLHRKCPFRPSRLAGRMLSQ